MKKSKLIKLIVFSLLFIFSLVPMITLTSIYSVDPKLELVSAEITEIRVNRLTSGSKSEYDKLVIFYSVNVKNNSITPVKSSYISVNIYSGEEMVASTSCGDNIKVNTEMEITNSYSAYRWVVEMRQDEKTLEDLTLEDLDIKARINGVTKEEITPILIGGLVMIPFVVIFGGMLLYTIFDKREENLEETK